MNKVLIRSEKQYVDLMFDRGYWDNPDFRKTYKTASWISLPEKYPCVVVDSYYYDSEFIYIEDFELRECQCGKFMRDSESRWPDISGSEICEVCWERIE